MSTSLSFRDLQVIWHPYTQHKNLSEPIAIEQGKGSLLLDGQGKAYIDAISSWWVNLHGHGHPYIAQKIYQQALLLEQVIFTRFTHRPAVELAERLLAALPHPFSRIFYSDNGSTAVEVALKMAIQYQKHKTSHLSAKFRTKIIALEGGYHGDTFGAMSVSARSLFTYSFEDQLFEVEFLPAPTPQNIQGLCERVQKAGAEAIAFIFEPLLQGAGGMLMHDSESLDILLKELKEQGVLLIADEVLTGFGRTGKPFASGYLSTPPDLICLSKGLTGGTMALGVTAATREVFDGFWSDDRSKTFFHGHSFTANPLACSAALASLDLFLSDSCQNQIRWLSQAASTLAAKLRETYPAGVAEEFRSLGTILAFDMCQTAKGYLSGMGPVISEMAIKNGIYLRPLGNTVYIMPPYCLTQEEWEKLASFLLNLPDQLKEKGISTEV